MSNIPQRTNVQHIVPGSFTKHFVQPGMRNPQADVGQHRNLSQEGGKMVVQKQGFFKGFLGNKHGGSQQIKHQKPGQITRTTRIQSSENIDPNHGQQTHQRGRSGLKHLGKVVGGAIKSMRPSSKSNQQHSVLIPQPPSNSRPYSMNKFFSKDNSKSVVEQENKSYPHYRPSSQQQDQNLNHISGQGSRGNSQNNSIKAKSPRQNSVNSNFQKPVQYLNQKPSKPQAKIMTNDQPNIDHVTIQNKMLTKSGTQGHFNQQALSQGIRNPSFSSNGQQPLQFTHAPVIIRGSLRQVVQDSKQSARTHATTAVNSGGKDNSYSKQSSNSMRPGTGEKLPQIPINQKLQTMPQRWNNQVVNKMMKCDRQTLDNVYHVSEYCQEIQQNMINKELKFEVYPTYMNHQTKIQETIRSTLIDWLIQTHYNFKLLPESLFLTVNIIDRYFSQKQITKWEVQLVGAAAMLVATKYEEIYPPLLKDFVYITDNKYKADEILDMEKSILFALDFDLQLTSSYRFLERFAKISKLDSVTYSLSQYLLELSLLDSKMNQFSQSLQAIAAIYTAKKYLKHYQNCRSDNESTCIDLFNVEYKYSQDEVKTCARCFNQLAKMIQDSKLQMLVQKFKHAKHYEVSRIVASVLKNQKANNQSSNRDHEYQESTNESARERNFKAVEQDLKVLHKSHTGHIIYR